MDKVTVPRRASELLASYGSYEDAQEAIDQLADQKFPVERLSIVAGDLQLVEQVTGRRGYGQAALEGLGTGALTGAFVGFIFGLFSLIDPPGAAAIGLALWGAGAGALIGLLIGVIGHAISAGGRDFSSVTSLRAGHYDVFADPAVAVEARAKLEGFHRLRRD